MNKINPFGVSEIDCRTLFLKKVDKQESCWIWNGCYSRSRGYGRFKYLGKTQYAHRVSYEIFKEKIPYGLVVMHQCDNPRCVNPDHLTVGTQKENVNDFMDKKCNKLFNKLFEKLGEKNE